jgi:hypothetical protein
VVTSLAKGDNFLFARSEKQKVFIDIVIPHFDLEQKDTLAVISRDHKLGEIHGNTDGVTISVFSRFHGFQ